MSNSHKKVELLGNLANVAIIIVAILLVAVLVNIGLSPTPPKSVAVDSPQIKPGAKLSLADMDWTKSGQTLLLILSTNCRYCAESAPFYQRLAQQKAGRNNIRLVAVLPQSIGEGQKYLSDHSISVDEVRQSPPLAAYANATPALVLIDRTGSVVESWVGKLPPQKEAEVLDRFLSEQAGN